MWIQNRLRLEEASSRHRHALTVIYESGSSMGRHGQGRSMSFILLISHVALHLAHSVNVGRRLRFRSLGAVAVLRFRLARGSGRGTGPAGPARLSTLFASSLALASLSRLLLFSAFLRLTAASTSASFRFFFT